MGWDREVDYEKALRLLKGEYERASTPRKRGAVAVLAVQLTNGCRVSEALEALEVFAKTRRREVKVRVRKRKEEGERLVVIPAFITSDVLVPTKRYVQYVARQYGFTTHSLRYAFVTYLARRGVAPQIIARITGHKRLDHILHYTEKVAAEEVLRQLVK